MTVGSTKTSAASFFSAGIDVGFEVVTLGDGAARLADQARDGPAAGGDPAALEGLAFQVATAGFGADFSKLLGMDGPQGAEVIVADPIDACTTLRNTIVVPPAATTTAANANATATAAANAPLIMLVRRGSCVFGLKALAVQGLSGSLGWNNRVALMLVVNNEEGPPSHMVSQSARPSRRKRSDRNANQTRK